LIRHQTKSYFMKKTYFLIILSIFTLINHSFAQQPGYVITQTNDTIKCTVKNGLLGGTKYQLPNGDFKKITKKDIKEYQLTKDSSVYIVQYPHEEDVPEFLQWIERGKINLYQQISSSSTYNASTNMTTGSSTNTWYISKNDSALILLKTNGWFTFGGSSHKERETTFIEMISDDPVTLADLKKANSFDFKTIRKYIKQYNQNAAQKR